MQNRDKWSLVGFGILVLICACVWIGHCAGVYDGIPQGRALAQLDAVKAGVAEYNVEIIANEPVMKFKYVAWRMPAPQVTAKAFAKVLEDAK